ncbi:GNAT family N-acetyltransferase [Corticibacterium sp. UT-5YL-CI-8]|nr:GNAT family N-acetyltransferase [Tianweitania sp. UT-5YL-CI-8]
MFVRTAGERDLERVCALLSETWHATYDAIHGVERGNEITAEWHSLASLKSRLVRPASEFLVADDGKMLGGMAYAAASNDGKTVTLYQLYVLPAFQGRGIGSALLQEVELSFPEAGRIRLEVEAENTRAVDFYGQRGFLPALEQVQGAASPEHVLVLEKLL